MSVKKMGQPAKQTEPVISARPLDMELELLWEERDAKGNRYDLYLGRIARSPVVRSHATGKYFMLPWSEIITIAQQHGIEKK